MNRRQASNAAPQESAASFGLHVEQCGALPSRRYAGLGIGVASVFAFGAAILKLCAAPLPPAEKLLPEDTLAMVTAPDFAVLKALLQQTPQSRLWRDPAMKPFRSKFTAKWEEEFVKPLERDLNIRFEDYLDLPQGQFTLALTQDGWDGQSGATPAFLLLLDAKDKGGKLKKNLADVRQKWVEAGKTLRTEKIRDIEFIILTLTSNDVPKTLRRFTDGPTNQFPAPTDAGESKKPETKIELAVGQFESLLLLGNSTKAVEKVVAHLTGGSLPALGDVAAFEADRLAQFRDVPFYGWVNTRRVVDVLNKLPTPTPLPDQPPPLDVKALLNASGFAALKSLAFSYRATGDGSLSQFTLGLPETLRTGLAQILAPEPKDASPPAFVPADVVEFRRMRLDGQKTWAAIEKMAKDIGPEGANVLNLFLQTADKAGKERDPGFDIRKDVVANLGDDWVTWAKPPRGNKLDDLESTPSLILMGSPNAERLVITLGALLSVVPQAGPPKQRDFLGRKIFSATPPMFGPPDNPQGTLPTLHYAASGGYIGFSKDESLLEEWLRSTETPPKQLRDTPGLKDALAKAGGTDKGWVTYENRAEAMRAFFTAIKSDPDAVVPSLFSGPLVLSVSLVAEGKGRREWVDFALLPPWDAVAKYFHYTITTGSANADGITFRYFSPTPPGLEK